MLVFPDSCCDPSWCPARGCLTCIRTDCQNKRSWQRVSIASAAHGRAPRLTHSASKRASSASGSVGATYPPATRPQRENHQHQLPMSGCKLARVCQALHFSDADMNSETCQRVLASVTCGTRLESRIRLWGDRDYAGVEDPLAFQGFVRIKAKGIEAGWTEFFCFGHACLQHRKTLCTIIPPEPGKACWQGSCLSLGGYDPWGPRPKARNATSLRHRAMNAAGQQHMFFVAPGRCI